MQKTRAVVWTALCLTTAAPGLAQASDFGCKVLLCLASPKGPRQFVECVPPIDQLFRDLAKGRPFPTCDFADGNDGSNFARPAREPYEPCPEGLTPAAAGSMVGEGYRKGAYVQLTDQQYGTSEGGDGSARACVGQLLGSFATGSAEDTRYVNVFDKVVWQQYKGYNGIDVFINNKLFNRIWW